MEIKAFATATGEFELHQSMPAAIQVGDQVEIYAGCDKSLTTCTSKFSNANNFRGFPHVHIWVHVAENPDVPVTSHFG